MPKQTKRLIYHNFRAIIHREGKWFVAEYPEVGTVSQGKTLEAALVNLKEVTELFAENFSNSSPSQCNA